MIGKNFSAFAVCIASIFSIVTICSDNAANQSIVSNYINQTELQPIMDHFNVFLNDAKGQENVSKWYPKISQKKLSLKLVRILFLAEWIKESLFKPLIEFSSVPAPSNDPFIATVFKMSKITLANLKKEYDEFLKEFSSVNYNLFLSDFISKLYEIVITYDTDHQENPYLDSQFKVFMKQFLNYRKHITERITLSYEEPFPRYYRRFFYEEVEILKRFFIIVRLKGEIAEEVKAESNNTLPVSEPTKELKTKKEKNKQEAVSPKIQASNDIKKQASHDESKLSAKDIMLKGEKIKEEEAAIAFKKQKSNDSQQQEQNSFAIEELGSSIKDLKESTIEKEKEAPVSVPLQIPVINNLQRQEPPFVKYDPMIKFLFSETVSLLNRTSKPKILDDWKTLMAGRYSLPSDYYGKSNSKEYSNYFKSVLAFLEKEENVCALGFITVDDYINLYSSVLAKIELFDKIGDLSICDALHSYWNNIVPELEEFGASIRLERRYARMLLTQYSYHYNEANPRNRYYTMLASIVALIQVTLNHERLPFSPTKIDFNDLPCSSIYRNAIASLKFQPTRVNEVKEIFKQLTQ